MALWSRYKVRRLSKGYFGRSKNCFRIAIRRVFKALQYKYFDRRVRRRTVRKNWILSLNAGVRDHGINYSRFIYGLNRSNILLDRKILADLAQNEPYSFKAVVDEIKEQVELPLHKKEEEMSYKEALEKKFLYHGEYIHKDTSDIEFKFAALDNPHAPDWFGLNREDFPSFYKKVIKDEKNEQIPLPVMKKMPFTAYDDIPSDPDDDL